MIFYYIYLIFVILSSIVLKKKGFFLNFTGDNHQSFSNLGNIPLSGGFFLILPIVFFYLNDLIFVSFIVYFFLSVFFLTEKF